MFNNVLLAISNALGQLSHAGSSGFSNLLVALHLI